MCAIIKWKVRIVDFGSGDTVHVKVAFISDLKPGLERLFRLWTKEGPSPAATEEESEEEEEEEEDLEGKPEELVAPHLHIASGLFRKLSPRGPKTRPKKP